MVASSGLTAQQTEADEIPTQGTADARSIGHEQPGDGKGIADHCRSLAADAVHQRRDRRGKKQEPKENHRRQKTHGTLLALGKFTADDVGHRSHDIAEAHDKEPHQHRCQQSFVHSPFRHSTSFNIHYLVKVKFFSRNTQRKPCIFLSGIPVFRQKKHCYSPFFVIFVENRIRL